MRVCAVSEGAVVCDRSGAPPSCVPTPPLAPPFAGCWFEWGWANQHKSVGERWGLVLPRPPLYIRPPQKLCWNLVEINVAAWCFSSGNTHLLWWELRFIQIVFNWFVLVFSCSSSGRDAGFLNQFLLFWCLFLEVLSKMNPANKHLVLVYFITLSGGLHSSHHNCRCRY